MQRVLTDFKPADIFSNPLAHSTRPENTIAEALILKAKTLEQLYLKEKKERYLATAIECYELMLAVWKKLRDTYDYESSHHLVLEENRQYLEKAIELSHFLWQKNKNKEYLKKAFYFSQQAKNLLLLESIQQADAVLKADVPDTLLERQKGIILKLNWLEKQLLHEKNYKKKH